MVEKACWLLKTPEHQTSRCPDGSWCWWCCHPCLAETLHLPFRWDSLRNTFDTMGAFCNWGCMKSFNIDRNGITRGGIVAQNILVMRKQMTGQSTPIQAAPNRYALNVFGGTLTIEEFRSMSEATGPIVRMPDEMHRVHMGPQQVVRDSSTPHVSNPEDKLNAIQATMTTNKTLKLKRPIPLKRDAKDNLEKSLGIKRKG